MKKTQSITGCMMDDHERLMNLFNDFKKTKNRDNKKAKELFSKFDSELRKHFDAEETLIRLSFRKNGNKKINPLPIASSLRLEHDRIKNILARILSSMKNSTKLDTFDLYLVLNHHKNVEERLLYPELDEMLSQKEKNKIFEKINGGKK